MLHVINFLKVVIKVKILFKNSHREFMDDHENVSIDPRLRNTTVNNLLDREKGI